MITYNHASFIKDAINGVLNQKTKFPVVLIISDDCSTDQTKIEIENLINTTNTSIKIEYIRHSCNVGMMPNFIGTLQKSKGKYIALCEGDDFWTDPYKLQKQVDFLEANPDFNICFHRVNVLKGTQLVPDWITKCPTDVTDIKDLIHYGNYIHTPSVLFRNIGIEFQKGFFVTPIGDYFLYVLLTQNGGKIKYLDETMAVYRYGVGIHSGASDENNYWAWSIMLYLIFNSVKAEYKERFKQKHIESRNGLKNLLYPEAAKDLSTLDRFISLKVIFKLFLFKIKRKIIKK